MRVALVGGEGVIAVYESEEHAREQAAALGIEGLLVPVPPEASNDPARLRLQIHYRLEKFAGDVQSDETLIETIEGEG